MTGFSRPTIVELMETLAFSSHDEIGSFLDRFEIEEADNRGSLPSRMRGIAKYLIENPSKLGPFGANLTLEIIEYLLETKRSFQLPEEAFPRLVRSLKHDGYVIENHRLKRMIPEDLQLAEKENELTTLLNKFGFATAKGHFNLAVSEHTRGEWAGANAQMRTFFESLLDSIAEALVDDAAILPPPGYGRRELLSRLDPPFLLTELNEWDAQGKGFVQGFWKRLHPEGSHPGLSGEEDSTLRLHLIIIVASHYLRRLDTRIG